MRMTGVATPFTSYTIPPNAPEPVAEAWRELNRIGILYDDASDALKDAGQALVAAQAADVQAIVDATNAGERGEGSPGQRAEGAGRDRTPHDRQARTARGGGSGRRRVLASTIARKAWHFAGARPAHRPTKPALMDK